MTDNSTNNGEIDVLRVFDYALSNGEVELLLEHDKSGHETGDYPCCAVCQNDMINIVDSEDDK